MSAMVQLLVAVIVVVVAVGAGLVLRRRQVVDPPTQQHYDVPAQLDRDDFAGREAPWLVAVFTSATCHVCEEVLHKAEVLQCADVVVANVEYTAAKQVHAKYRIEGVPLVAIADSAGVVRAGFVGPVTATDLWAAVAEARQPGTTPEPDLGR